MPPHASRSLENQVNWREIGCYQVKIQIKALLDHLSGNEDLSAFPIPAPPENLYGMVLAFLPAVSRKAGVKKEHFRSIGKAFADTLAFTLQNLTLRKKPVQLLRSLHRINKCQPHSATGKMLLQRRAHRRQIRRDTYQSQSAAASWVSLEMRLFDRTRMEDCEARVIRLLLR
jgi:hypothetical protein